MIVFTKDEDEILEIPVGLGPNVTDEALLLQSKTADPSTASQTVVPDSNYDGLSRVIVNAVTSDIDSNIAASNIKSGVTILGVEGTYSGGSTINNQDKTVNPSTNQQIITSDEGYTGLGTVTVQPYTLKSITVEPSIWPMTYYAQTVNGLKSVHVNGVTSSIDSNITAGNIKSGVTILGVTGDYSGSSINNQDKTVNSSTVSQSITADNGYTGLGTVTVNPYTLDSKTVDSSTVSQTINSSADGLSSVTVNPYELDSKTVNSSTLSQTITSDKDGLSSVTVNPYTLDTKTVNPSTNSLTVLSSADGMASVTVNAVTSSIDSNIAAGNIKSGVTILGIEGTYSGTVNNQNKTIDASTVSQSITADSGYSGLGTVTVNAVTSSIDSNIAAGNIKDGVTILGVTGNYSGSSDTGVQSITYANSNWSYLTITNARKQLQLWMHQSSNTITGFPIITNSPDTEEVYFNYLYTISCTYHPSVPCIDSTFTKLRYIVFQDLTTVTSPLNGWIRPCTNITMLVNWRALTYADSTYNITADVGSHLTDIYFTLYNEDYIADTIYLSWASNLSDTTVLNLLNNLGNISGKSVNFYSGGLTFRDNYPGSLQTAYNNAVNAGWTINNLTILPYS